MRQARMSGDFLILKRCYFKPLDWVAGAAGFEQQMTDCEFDTKCWLNLEDGDFRHFPI